MYLWFGIFWWRYTNLLKYYKFLKLECTNTNGIQYKVCNYKNCKDGIWTWGEACDDGNSVNRDGCSDCLVDAGYSCVNVILEPSICHKCPDNCSSCDSDLKCQACINGYFLQSNSC